MKPTGILKTAENIVHNERGHYASPDKDFARTAHLLSALGFRKRTDLHPETEGTPVQYITPTDVGYIMICVKLSRLMHEFDVDGLIDIAGYVECIGIIRDIYPEED